MMDSMDQDQLFSFTAPKPALGTELDVLTLATYAHCQPGNKSYRNGGRRGEEDGEVKKTN